MYYLYVAIFGAIGAAARYWISITLEAGLFPYNTLLINIIGCFLMAVILRYLASFSMISNTLVTGLGTGLIGSFTTFSSFSMQNAGLILDGHYITAGLYILSSLMGGFLSAGLGVYVSNKLIAERETAQDD
ncbi:MAG TPA: CrcB family protein [Bacillota bacterium]|nr:CrcB family protein [Bacillota bacterium]